MSARRRSAPGPTTPAGPDYSLDQLVAFGRELDQEVGGSGETRRVRLMRELLRIRDKAGRLVELLPNRAQREFDRAATQKNIVLKARQVGMTTWIAARFFVGTITQPGTVTVQVAHDQAAAEQIFRIVHRFLANLPEAMREGALETSRANVRQLVFPRLDSEYRVETAADREAGRGLTIRNLHGSEVARWPGDPAETLAGLRAAVVPGGTIVLESTPNGAAGCFYDEWQRALETGTTRHFFPWWYEASYVAPAAGLGALTEEELVAQARGDLTPEQIAFRRGLRANFGRLAPQEYAEDPAECFLASGECVFDLEALERRRAELPAARSTDSGRLQAWYPPQPARTYIVGVDPAGGGVGGDYSCAEVIDRSLGLQCAELHGHLAPAELARRVAQLAREYNGALVAVERNNHGHAVLMSLERLEHYENVYAHDGKTGWPTSAATRPLMIENLVALVATAPELIVSERLLAECRTFVRRKDGSPSAAPGAHDDCVMAMAIAQQVRSILAGGGPRRGVVPEAGQETRRERNGAGWPTIQLCPEPSSTCAGCAVAPRDT